jgi:LSD1 subclass zinc finger protein
MSKRSRYSGKDGKGNKKLPLDVFFEDTHSLIKGYSSEQLRDLLDKIKDLESAVDRALDYDNEVQEILGAKLEGKVMWFSVKWGGGEKSFIPAHVLNRIAPEKVIQYYESVLQFLPNPNPKDDAENKEGSDMREENDWDESTPQKFSRTESSDRRNVPLNNNNNNNNNNKGGSRSSRERRTPEELNSMTFVPPKVNRTTQFKKINCSGCSILLQYPEGTKVIKCPSCHAIMSVV